MVQNVLCNCDLPACCYDLTTLWWDIDEYMIIIIIVNITSAPASD